jgi:hypothetical protein
MIAGRSRLNLWYFEKAATRSVPANNLELLFPEDPGMKVVNGLLKKCVVEHQEQCLTSASDLLSEVDRAISFVVGVGRKPDDGSAWLCTVCGKGYYQDERTRKESRTYEAICIILEITTGITPR